MLVGPEGAQSIEITIEPHAGIRRRCSRCQKPAPGYDCLPQRRWLFVPLWGIATYFCYAPRRVECGEHGIVRLATVFGPLRHFDLAHLRGWA
jgi:hypothetical protein